MPVMSESWAFQSSTGRFWRRDRVYLPSSTRTSSSGTIQGCPAAHALERDPLQADLLEEFEPLRRLAAVPLRILQLGLHLDVGALAAAADLRALDVHVGDGGRGIQLELPHERAAQLIRQQAADALADDRWMQRDAPVGRVHRLPALARLGVDRTAGCDQGRQVRDRVVHLVGRRGVGVVSLEVQRLVEVGRALRVDRHERHVREVAIGQDVGGDRRGRLGFDLGRERLGQLQLPADLLQRRREQVVLGVGELAPSARRSRPGPRPAAASGLWRLR